MNKIIASIVFLMSLQLRAEGAVPSLVHVDCHSPLGMAGAPVISLYGDLDIAVSSTTGMTKLKDGSSLTVEREAFSKTGQEKVVQNIIVSGTYYGFSRPRISANQEPTRPDIDDRTYSSIEIDGDNSFLYELYGNSRHLLICKITDVK